MTNASAPLQQRLDKLFAIRSTLGRVHDLRRLFSLGILWFVSFLASMCGLVYGASNQFYLYILICSGVLTVILVTIMHVYNSIDYEAIDESISVLENELRELADSGDNSIAEDSPEETSDDAVIKIKKVL